MNPSISLQFGSKTWNGRYSQLARRSKKIAILREQSGNAPKQRVNFSSCWSHCRTDLCGWECFTGAKDSRGLSSIKRTGKILWKGEHIVKNRNRLRMNRDNVHLHIGSRTGQVTKLLYCYLQLITSYFFGWHSKLGKDNYGLTEAYSSLIGRLFILLGISNIFNFILCNLQKTHTLCLL